MTFCVRLTLVYFVLIGAFLSVTERSSSAQSSATTPTSVESRRQQLLSLFDEQWQYGLRTSPEWATMLGDSRYNDRLSDNSPEFFKSDVERKREFLTRFEAIDPAGL